MRLGLIARADNRGLGQQTWAVYRQLQPAKTMVIDCPSAQPLPLYLERFPDATVVHGLPTRADFRRWLQDLDVVYTAETGYGQALWDEAERAGVRTVLHANYEFLNRDDRPSVWAAPSLWHVDDFPDGVVYLPVPIETDRFPVRADFPAARPASRFLHIVGRPAIHDRNGTADLLTALQHVTAEVSVTVRCQDTAYVGDLLGRSYIPPNVTLELGAGDTENYWDNYRDADVLVMPRRFGGLCLPAQEAIGAGMPVIMPDISPNNTWLPNEWLVPATPAGSFMAKQRVELHTVNHLALAAKIDQFATDPEFFERAQLAAMSLRHELSWDALRPTYEKGLA